MFFYSPSEVAEKTVQPGARLRVGGLVEGRLARQVRSGRHVIFDVTDGAHDVKRRLSGPASPVPDLFREGQGVVAEGVLAARRPASAPRPILAKHDERYMPREVVDALKKQGRWQEGRGERQMIVEIGHFALILALALALAQTIVPAWGARRGDPAPDGGRAERRARPVRARRASPSPRSPTRI